MSSLRPRDTTLHPLSFSAAAPGPVLMDVRRDVISAAEYVMPVVERRKLAIERGELWVVNLAYSKPDAVPFNIPVEEAADCRKALCIVQPFKDEAEKAATREAFEARSQPTDTILPSLEMLGTKVDVRRALLPLIRANDVVILFLPRDVWAPGLNPVPQNESV